MKDGHLRSKKMKHTYNNIIITGSEGQIGSDSIKNSLNFFIKKVKSKSAFSLTQYNNALKTLKFFL